MGSLMACLLKNEPASYPVCGKVKSVKDAAVAKASLKQGVTVAAGRPETE